MNIRKFLTVKNLFLLLIFFVIVFLRFLKAPQAFFFDIDEEYQSLLALSIIKDFHIIWIGLSAANTGFYIGPGLVYFHAFFLWLSRLDPVVLSYIASSIGCLTIIIFFLVVKYLFNKKIALISAIIYSFSAFVVSFDRRFWNSSFVPLISILFYFSFVKALKNTRFLILTFFLLGLSFHIHASLFIFIPIALIMIYRFIINKNNRVDLVTIIFSVLIFLIIYSPLIVFDIVHNFDNLKTPLRLLQNLGQNSNGSFLISNLIIFKNTLYRFLFNIKQPTFVSFMVFFSLLIILILFFLRKKNKKEKILSVIIFFYLLMFIFYPGKILDYYYLGFLPFFSIVISYFLSNINKFTCFIIIFLFITSSVLINISQIKQNEEKGLSIKKKLIINTIKVLDKKSFYLETNHQYLYFGGWRYLFEAYGKVPNQSHADEMFGWIYPKEITKMKPELKIIITDKKIKTTDKPIKIINVGKYYSYILNYK